MECTKHGRLCRIHARSASFGVCELNYLAMFHENAQFNFRIHLIPKTRHLQLGNYYLLLHIVGHGVTSLKLGARLFSLARILRCISPDVVVMGLSFASL